MMLKTDRIFHKGNRQTCFSVIGNQLNEASSSKSRVLLICSLLTCVYFRWAMIEQERRDRELALRLTQDPDALDAEVQQAPQLPLQR